MSENGNHAPADTSRASITFDVFEAFYRENPDLDNAEYYSNFPNVNQGTIRSWKAKAKKIPPEESPSKQRTAQNQDMSDIIEPLIKLTGINQSLLKGLSPKAQLNFLKNAAAMMTDGRKEPQPNIGIIPTPARSSKRTLGIEKYITFDPHNRMVKMVIPATVAHDPKLNKKLGEYIEE